MSVRISAPAKNLREELAKGTDNTLDKAVWGDLTVNGSVAADNVGSYSTGSWVPVVMDATLSDSEGQTYSVQTGTYTKVGNVVHCFGTLTMSSLGTLTTTDRIRLGGLPVTASSGVLQIGYASGLAIATNAHITGLIESGTQYLNLWEWNAPAGPSGFTLAELTASGSLAFTITYEAQ